jgi:hypothetical protein
MPWSLRSLHRTRSIVSSPNRSGGTGTTGITGTIAVGIVGITGIIATTGTATIGITAIGNVMLLCRALALFLSI